MLERDAAKKLSGRIEIDDAYVGGERRVDGKAAGGEHVSRNSFSSICRASRSAAHTSSSPAMFMRARRLPWA